LLLQKVSSFYERYESIGLKVTFVLVSLQIIHLIWLTTFVILDAPELTGGIPPIVFAVIDYLEVPALVSGLIFYGISAIEGRSRGKDIIYTGLLTIQFLHLYWITDTFIYMSLNFGQYVWLALVAILIDYAEVPVIVDLFRKLKLKSSLGK